MGQPRKELTMKRLILAAALAGLLLPAAALAKEPSVASISGPGFEKTLRAPENDNFTSTALGRLTDATGFFPAAVGQSPDPMLPGRPAGSLGPRYTTFWTVPVPGHTHRVRQDLYPYAEGGALTYMKPGQPIYESRTVGGWYRAYGLKQELVRLGLAARPVQDAKSSSYALFAGIGIPGVLALTGAFFLVRRSRLRREAP
jgi:hypothetical protein